MASPNSPNILVDVSSLLRCQGKISGIPRVVASVLWEWMQDENFVATFFYCLEPAGEAVTSSLDAVLHHYQIYGYDASAIDRTRFSEFQEKRGIETILDAERENIVILPGASWIFPTLTGDLYRLRAKRRLKTVSVAYDLIPYLLPHTYGPGFPESFTATMADTFWLSDLVLSISQSTRNDCAAFCETKGIPKPALEVFRLGDDLIQTPSTRPDWFSPDWDGKPFLLCVGTLELRKNHQALYEAWKVMKARGFGEIPRLIMVGRNGWLFDSLRYQLQHDPQVNEHFVLAENCHDGHLRWLYENCAFTLYPSLYEGWGLPVTESLSYGKYCVTCPVSSLPEAGGDFAGYCAPQDPVAWADHIMLLLDHPEVLAAKEQKIAKDYQPATWLEAAQQFWTHVERHVLTA